MLNYFISSSKSRMIAMNMKSIASTNIFFICRDKTKVALLLPGKLNKKYSKIHNLSVSLHSQKEIINYKI